MFDKIVLMFFTFAFYIVLIRVVNYILPGFIAVSSLGIVQIAVLIVLLVPSFLLARKAVKYLQGE